MPLMAQIGVGIIDADLSQLYKVSDKLVKNGADFLHLDVNDGVFVPPLTFGPPVIKSLRNNLKDVVFEAHMMVNDPKRWIELMADAGVDRYAFHIEATEKDDVATICRKIREAGMSVAIAIKPETNVKELETFIGMADMIMVMFVDIADHKFQRDVLSKVKWLRENYPNLDIQADGGVSLGNVDDCAHAGANVIVAGSAVLTASNQKETIKRFRSAMQQVFPDPAVPSSMWSSLNCWNNYCPNPVNLYPVKELIKRYSPK